MKFSTRMLSAALSLLALTSFAFAGVCGLSSASMPSGASVSSAKSGTYNSVLHSTTTPYLGAGNTLFFNGTFPGVSDALYAYPNTAVYAADGWSAYAESNSDCVAMPFVSKSSSWLVFEADKSQFSGVSSSSFTFILAYNGESVYTVSGAYFRWLPEWQIQEGVSTANQKNIVVGIWFKRDAGTNGSWNFGGVLSEDVAIEPGADQDVLLELLFKGGFPDSEPYTPTAAYAVDTNNNFYAVTAEIYKSNNPPYRGTQRVFVEIPAYLVALSDIRLSFSAGSVNFNYLQNSWCPKFLFQ